MLLLWRHRGKILGTFLGFLVGWFLVHYGLFKLLVVLAVTALGLFLGARWDGEDVHVDWSRLRRRWNR